MFVSNILKSESQVKRRFLLYFSYYGTKFRGIQKQLGANNYPDTCVTFAIEKAIDELLCLNIKPNQDILFYSSRTDAGVHALENTAHVDLETPMSFKRNYCSKKNKLEKKGFEDSEILKHLLNGHMEKHGKEIRINKIVPVPSTFHARHSAISRTYYYRFGIVNNITEDMSSLNQINMESYIPIPELYKTCFFRGPIDIEAMQEACSLLKGEKDFGSFTNVKLNYSESTSRNLYQVDLSPTVPVFNPSFDPLYDNIDFYKFVFSASSFLYHQIRQTVGILLTLGSGNLDLEHFKSLLTNPCSKKPAHLLRAEPCGLYLVKVEYPKEALEITTFNSVRPEKDEHQDRLDKVLRRIENFSSEERVVV